LTIADMENLSIDSASIRVHESVTGGEKQKIRQLAVPGGGLTTKIHAIVDGLGAQWYFCRLQAAIMIPPTL